MSIKLDIDTLELLDELRKKLDLVEAYWYFVEHGVDGFCCPNALKAKARFEARDAEEVLDLIRIIHRRDKNGEGNRSS